MNCTWDYTPLLLLSGVTFQNGWNQTVTFQSNQGFSAGGGSVDGKSAPTITPNGSSGSNSYPAITLTGGSKFSVASGGTLFLQGYSSGNAVFMTGDGTAGEYLNNNGDVSYLGVASTTGTANYDYLLIPVLNAGNFYVNGNGNGTTSLGGVLNVTGTDTNTNGASFYQANASATTNILGNGTLWCYNDYTMTKGLLQTKDTYLDILMVGTTGGSPVDGTVNLLGGTVRINAGTSNYGKLQIAGTTGANAPTLNLGAVTLEFKVNMTEGSNQCDQLFVGKTTGTGKVNFSNNSTTTTVSILAQGTVTTGHKWPIIYFGSATGKVALSPANVYKANWSNSNWLEIDN